MIYRLLLEEPQQITIVQDKPYRSSIAKLVVSTFHDENLHKGLVFDATARKWQKQEPSPLAILRVSKLLLQESAAVMYGENSFSLSDTSRLKEFLVAIGTMRQNLRFVSVRAHGYTASAIRSAFNLLKDAKGLRAVTFHYTSISTFSRYGLVGPGGRQSRQDAATSFIRDCRPLLRVLQKAQRKVEVPVDVLGIITVGWEEEACCSCSEGKDSWGCRRVSDGSCADLPGDCREINARIRELAARELGIKMLT
ncbi:hypothetical protein Tdes44962_MAKER05777 [Teratosphaeria destructans]|uniref:Uncharacterized protein n=1 Tax=Teratosphaeria destructans TaxID=418781 RepID=A0A9W7SIZ4_9PEZI|nr:hypothetical protein Tdes44962_MAKER05777 [Teratosphaeria destructans]